MKKPDDDLGRMIQRDLEAFGRISGRDLPGWSEAEAQLRSRFRPRGRSAWGSRRLRAAAWLGAAAMAAVILVFVPFSYSTVAGQQVTLVVPWLLSDAAQAEAARGLRAIGKVEAVRVDVSPRGSRLTVLVRDVTERHARANVEAFARSIKAFGPNARVIVRPETTIRDSSVYGYAADRLRHLWIDVDSRTNEQIEQDVRERLAAIGFREADVSVSVQHAPGRTDIKFRATDGEGRVEENEYRRELRGTAGSTPSNEPPLELRMPDLSDLDDLPIAQRRDALEKRLRDLGIEARVTIENGQLRVDAVHEVIRRPNRSNDPNHR